VYIKLIHINQKKHISLIGIDPCSSHLTRKCGRLNDITGTFEI
jgi:hypothetical protein